MAYRLPPDGLPMLMAIERLGLHESLSLLPTLDQLVLREESNPTVAGLARAALAPLLVLAFNGQVEFTGYLDGDVHWRIIALDLLPQSLPDFQKQRLKTDIGVFWNVFVRPASYGQIRVFTVDDPAADAASSALGMPPVHQLQIGSATAAVDQAEVPLEPVDAARPPGRPSSAPLYVAEFLARYQRGEMSKTLGAEARKLLAWLKKEHPEASLPTVGTLENNIRVKYKAMKTSMKIPTKI